MKNAAVTNKDIFTIPNGVILQICNIAGGYGAGFSGEIEKHYPGIRQHYKKLYRDGKLTLGGLSRFQPYSNVVVANLYAMANYRRSKEDTTIYLDYDALDSSLAKLSAYLYRANRYLPLVPYGMGCGNAGGDWSKVTELLDKHLAFYVVCKLS